MAKKIVVQKDKEGRTFIDLPTDVMECLKLKIGDWIELSIDGKSTYLHKVYMYKLKTSLPPVRGITMLCFPGNRIVC